MDDDRDSDEVEEQHQAFRSGRVRIIGAQPADPTLSVPVVRTDSEPTGAGDDEHHANGSGALETEHVRGEPARDEASAEPDLPHWTEAPTGEVPAVLARDRGSSGSNDDPWSSLPAPTWREGEADWEVESQSFEPSMLSQGDAGIAPRKESEEAERQPWTFELPDQETPELEEPADPRGGEDSSRLRAGATNDRSGPVSGTPSDEETLVSPLDAFDVPGASNDRVAEEGPDDGGRRAGSRFGWGSGRAREVEDADEVIAVRRRRGRGLHRPSASEPGGSLSGEDPLDSAGPLRLGDVDEGVAILAADDPAVAGESGIEPPPRVRIRRQRTWRSRSGLSSGSGGALDEEDTAGSALGALAAGGMARVTRSVRAARDQRTRRPVDALDAPEEVATRPRIRVRGEAPEPLAQGAPRAASKTEPADGIRRPVARAAPLPPGLRQTRPLRPPAAASAPPDRRRAAGGRNMTAAVITGAVLLGLLLVVFHFGTVPSVVVIAIIAFLATAEAYAAFRKAGYVPATPLGLLASVSLIWATYAKGPVALPLIVVLLVAFTLIWFMVGVQPNADPVLGTTTTLFVFCWIGVFSSYAALLLNPTLFPDRRGIAFLLGGIVTGVACDIGALAVGRLWGRHPLAPSISPNKTWEGVIGGAVFAVLAGVVIVHFIHPWTLDKAVVLGVVVAVVAPLGDLCESLVKRQLGLKDMGRILPGHGGLLDRVDGLLFVLPATYYLVKAFHLG